MIFKETWTDNALHDLSNLNPSVADRITKKVQDYCSTQNPFVFAKALTGDWKGFYRFRIGDYRAIFRKESDGTITIILILRVKHRKEIYD